MFVLGQVNLLTGSIFLPSHMSPSSSNRGVGCTASWHLRFWNMKHERWWNMHPWELDDLNVVIILLDIAGLSWPLGCVHYLIDTSPPHPFPFRSAPAGRSPWRPPLQLRKPLDDGQHVPGPWSLEHGPMASARLDMITNGHKEVILMDLTPSTKHHTTLLQYIDEIWWDHWWFCFFEKKTLMYIACFLFIFVSLFPNIRSKLPWGLAKRSQAVPYKGLSVPMLRSWSQ